MSNTVIYGIYYLYLGAVGYGFDLTSRYASVTFSLFDGYSPMLGDTNTMKDLGLVHDPIYGAYYIYLGNVAVGFVPYASELWAWKSEEGRTYYEDGEVKLLW